MFMQMMKEKKSVLEWMLEAVQDPKFYFTVALFAGELSPGFFPFSSGFMYFFFVIGLIVLAVNGKCKRRPTFSIVLLVYIFVLVRNIFGSRDTFFEYELPNLITFFILLFFNNLFYSDEDIDRIGEYIFTYSAILSFLGIVKFVLNPSERLAVFGGPNGYYKITLLFEVFCFCRFFQTKEKKYLGMAAIGILLCGATGSKGGIAAGLVVLMLELFFYVYNAKENQMLVLKRMFKILLISIVCLGILIVILDKVPALKTMFSRASSFLFQSDIKNTSSVSARTQVMGQAMGFFAESPILGKGARYTYYYTNGAMPYPHNIFIELLSEQGIVGTIPFICFFLGVIYSVIKYGKRDIYLFGLFLCFVVYFSGSMFSGNILDAKTIFAFGVLMHNYIINHKDFYWLETELFYSQDK